MNADDFFLYCMYVPIEYKDKDFSEWSNFHNLLYGDYNEITQKLKKLNIEFDGNEIKKLENSSYSSTAVICGNNIQIVKKTKNALIANLKRNDEYAEFITKGLNRRFKTNLSVIEWIKALKLTDFQLKVYFITNEKPN